MFKIIRSLDNYDIYWFEWPFFKDMSSNSIKMNMTYWSKTITKISIQNIFFSHVIYFFIMNNNYYKL